MSGEPLVTTRRSAVLSSMLAVWQARSAKGIESGPEAHIAAMIQGAVTTGALTQISGSTSDGYHTFDELYRHRLLLTAALFYELSKGWGEEDEHVNYAVHKSRRHHDGELPFGGGWFIVVAQLPTGQISYHYRDEDWDLFVIEERERAAEWDGHSAQDAADRLENFLRGRAS